MVDKETKRLVNNIVKSKKKRIWKQDGHSHNKARLGYLNETKKNNGEQSDDK